MKGESRAFVISLNTIYIDLYSDIYRPISFKLGLIIEITKLYIFTSVWMTLTFISRSQWCKKSNTLVSIFSQI